MVFVPAADTVKVDFRQTLYGQQISNTLYFRSIAGPFGVADVDTLTTELVQFWDIGLAPNLVEDLELRELYVTDLTTQTSPTWTYPVVPAGAGDLSVPGVPGNVTFCVSFRAAGRGRSSRGRNYIAGLAETDVTGNTYDGTRADSLVQAYIDGILTNSDLTALWEMVVVSTVENKAPRSSALIQPVTSVLYTDLTVDSQRRRLTGRGR
jgi:hypothetical protein